MFHFLSNADTPNNFKKENTPLCCGRSSSSTFWRDSSVLWSFFSKYSFYFTTKYPMYKTKVQQSKSNKNREAKIWNIIIHHYLSWETKNMNREYAKHKPNTNYHISTFTSCACINNKIAQNMFAASETFLRRFKSNIFWT